jgi:hypothetical protein
VPGDGIGFFAKRIHLLGLLCPFGNAKLDRLPLCLQAADVRRQGICGLAGRRAWTRDKDSQQ